MKEISESVWSGGFKWAATKAAPKKEDLSTVKSAEGGKSPDSTVNVETTTTTQEEGKAMATPGMATDDEDDDPESSRLLDEGLIFIAMAF